MKKLNLKTRTKFTIVAMANITWYTVAVLVLSAFGKNVPSELTTCFFAAWTIELALLFGLKIRNRGE